MTKKFIVTVSDDGTEEKIRGLLYLGNESPRADAVSYMLNIVGVSEVPQVTNGRMTFEQREKLWEMCGRYGVPFNESDYRVLLPSGMVEGWIGGNVARDADLARGFSNVRRTIYVGVEPNGNCHT